jgi:hypothetical protein
MPGLGPPMAAAISRRTGLQLARPATALGRAKTGPQAWGERRPGGQDEPAVAGHRGRRTPSAPEGTVCGNPLEAWTLTVSGFV